MFDWFWEAFASLTATVTFFTIFLVGVAFSVFSLIMGGHGDADHDFGHDFGGHDTDHGDGHGGGDHDGDSGFFNVGILSIRGIALLSTGFGGVGLLVHIATGKLWFSTLAGLASGYVFAFGVLYILKMFKAQQANSLISMDEAQGMEATVVTTIPSNGPGEIRFVLSGQEMVKMAYSANGEVIGTGKLVRIDRVNGGSLLVSRVTG